MHGRGGKKWCLKPGYYSRWAALAASILVNAFNLYSYAFGLFSDALKDGLGFSQVTVDVIASVGELGLWSSFLVGLLLERLSPRGVYFLGSVTTAVGLGYVSLAIGEVISSDAASVATMYYLANFGTACYQQTAASVAVRNFPAGDRGKVSGLIKSVFGLSSAVLSVSYYGLFGGENVERFLLFLCVGVPVLGTISSISLNLVPEKHISYALEKAQGVSPRMSPFYVWFAVLVLFLMSAAAVAFMPFSLPVPLTGILLVALVLLVSAIPVFYGRVFIKDAMLAFSMEPFNGGGSEEGWEGIEGGRERSDVTVCGATAEEENFGGELVPLLGSGNDVGGGNGLENENRTWKQCLVDTRFWVLYVSFLCGAGSGLVVINNVSSLAQSLEMESSSFLVTALGIANALGRLSAGWVSDRVVRAGLPRSVLFAGILLLTSGVDFLLAAGTTTLFYTLCVATGICYGAMFSLVLALTGDLFGVRHIGTNYGLLDLGPAAGSFIFATGVMSYFYGKAEVDGECIGQECFAGTFLCTAIACLVASFLVFVTLVRPGLKKRSLRA